MRQKFSVNVADVPMNIACEETPEAVEAAVKAIDTQVRALVSNKAHFCSKIEAALLTALDQYTQNLRLQERIKELEVLVHTEGPAGSGTPYEASLLRGENETLRAELQVNRGTHDALLQDNAILFRLNGKLLRQSMEANARADRMHDQVLSILTEVRELRDRLAEAEGEEVRALASNYENIEPEPEIEITPDEQQITHKYEEMDLDDILSTAPKITTRAAVRPADEVEEADDDGEGDELIDGAATPLSDTVDIDQ